MRRRLAALALAAMLASGCGGSSANTVPIAAAAAATDPRGISADVPDVAVVDVATGSTSSLRALLSGERPVLLWFWAPH